MPSYAFAAFNGEVDREVLNARLATEEAIAVSSTRRRVSRREIRVRQNSRRGLGILNL